MTTRIADGIEYEVVWSGEKSDPSLLPADYPAIDGRRSCRIVDGPSGGPMEDGSLYGFVIPGLQEDGEYAICVGCGIRFEPKRPEQRYHDRACKDASNTRKAAA